jgi:uncharacterized protein with NRDE domain
VCTLTLAWQVFTDAPVVAAANRDEADDRPSEPPQLLEHDPRVVAPRDAEAGGTWLGYNEHGVFVAVTNRWVEVERSGERSRGLLVRDALRQPTAEDAARLVERELRERAYEGFNLALVDENAAILLEWDGHLRVRNLEPGVHVVVNVGADDDFFVPERRPEVGIQQAENARDLRAHLQPEPGESSGAWLDRAAAAIRDHEFGACVHGDGFGTRSSSLVSIGEGGTSYRFAPGPPCVTEYRPVESQL